MRYWPFTLYIAVVVAYLWWSLATPGLDHLAGKAMLMPALIAAVLAIGLWTSPVIVASWRSIGAFVLLCIALAASLLGDVAMSDAQVLGLAGLGVALAAYIMLFAWPARTRRPSWWALAYPLAFTAIVWVLWPSFGALAGAVVAYGIVLVAAAALATGVNLIAAIGGACFFVADVGIAVRWFAPEQLAFFPDPWQDLSLMLGYCVAQGLLAYGVLHRLEAEPELAIARRAEAVRRRRATYRAGYESQTAEPI